MLPYTSDKSFVVYSYECGRGLLLLRSIKQKASDKRIDILFQDVRAMEIRSWFDGLQICEVGPEFLSGRQSRPISLLEVGNKVYSLSGHDWSGFIVAGIMSIHEDELQFSDPSALLK